MLHWLSGLRIPEILSKSSTQMLPSERRKRTNAVITSANREYWCPSYQDNQIIKLIDLPDELLLRIAEWLIEPTPKDLLIWSSSCKRLTDAVAMDNQVWKKIFEAKFDVGIRDLERLKSEQSQDWLAHEWKEMYKQRFLTLVKVQEQLIPIRLDWENCRQVEQTVTQLWKMTIDSKRKNLQRLSERDTGLFLLDVLTSLFNTGWHTYSWTAQALHVLVALLHVQGAPLAKLFKASPIWASIHAQVNQLNSLSFQIRPSGSHLAIAYMVQAYLFTCLVLIPNPQSTMHGYEEPPLGYQAPCEMFNSEPPPSEPRTENNSWANSFIAVADSSSSFSRLSMDTSRIPRASYESHLPAAAEMLFEDELHDDTFVGYYGYLRPELLHRPRGGGWARTDVTVWFDGPMVCKLQPSTAEDASSDSMGESVNRRFTFVGHDPIDQFTVQGTYNRSTGKVYFVKAYTNEQHSWKYEGLVTPFGLTGRWGTEDGVALPGTGGPFWFWRKRS